jgi:hypothetical protein
LVLVLLVLLLEPCHDAGPTLKWKRSLPEKASHVWEDF